MSNPLSTLAVILLVLLQLVFSPLLPAKEIQTSIQKNIQVDYKDLSFTVKQDSEKFMYQDKTLKKEYSIKPCNKSQFELFWSQYRIHKNDLTSLNKVDKKEALILKDDNKTSKINPDGKFGTFLTQIPNQIIAFEVNEKMKCKK
jgi:hypothetical protein